MMVLPVMSYALLTDLPALMCHQLSLSHLIQSSQADVLAGTSVAALVVPQGMSYAALAGLPSVYGLYGAFVPVLCYAALGSSRHLVSPNIPPSLMVLCTALKG